MSSPCSTFNSRFGRSSSQAIQPRPGPRIASPTRPPGTPSSPCPSTAPSAPPAEKQNTAGGESQRAPGGPIRPARPSRAPMESATSTRGQAPGSRLGTVQAARYWSPLNASAASRQTSSQSVRRARGFRANDWTVMTSRNLQRCLGAPRSPCAGAAFYWMWPNTPHGVRAGRGWTPSGDRGNGSPALFGIALVTSSHASHDRRLRPRP